MRARSFILRTLHQPACIPGSWHRQGSLWPGAEARPSRHPRPARLVAVLAVPALLIAACAGGGSPAPSPSPAPATPGPSGSPTIGSPASVTPVPATLEPGEIVLMTHDSFSISESTLDAFRAQTGITVRILQSGDAGAALNQAILTRDRPLADLLYGVDNTFLSRALEAGIFVPHASPLLDGVDPSFLLDPGHRLSPVDYGDVCVNFDREAFGQAQRTPPARLEDLTGPEYRGQLVVENPATSSPGLAFLLATIARFGETGAYTWRDYWRDLRANDVLVTAGWEDAYYGQFSGGSGEGDRPLVVSYASSPAAEVFFADPQPAEAPTGVLTDGCFRQVEFVGILAGTEHEAAARLFIDFMLSLPFQEDIPLNMFVFPVNRGAALPDVFVRHTTIPDRPLTLPAEQIQQNRERWIREWTDTVLR